jgi:hypothetical protein
MLQDQRLVERGLWRAGLLRQDDSGFLERANCVEGLSTHPPSPDECRRKIRMRSDIVRFKFDGLLERIDRLVDLVEHQIGDAERSGGCGARRSRAEIHELECRDSDPGREGRISIAIGARRLTPHEGLDETGLGETVAANLRDELAHRAVDAAIRARCPHRSRTPPRNGDQGCDENDTEN